MGSRRRANKNVVLVLGAQYVKYPRKKTIIVDNKLSFTNQVDSDITASNQSLFALRTMRQHELSNSKLQIIFMCSILAKILYAAPSYWGFLSIHNRTRLEAFLRRAVKFGYYDSNAPDLQTLEERAEDKLFNIILTNPRHVLHPYPPPLTETYNLRPSQHHLVLPNKDDRNYLNRMLYSNMY